MAGRGQAINDPRLRGMPQANVNRGGTGITIYFFI